MPSSPMRRAQGALPLTPQMLMESPSGNLFGMTQNAGMGWDANKLTGKEVLIIGTRAASAPGTDDRLRWATHRALGDRHADAGRGEGDHPQRRDPVCGLRQRSVRRALAGHARDVRLPAVPQRCGDCVSSSDSLLPTRRAVIGVATCDKGLPATMIALASMHNLPTILVPGGATLPPTVGERGQGADHRRALC